MPCWIDADWQQDPPIHKPRYSFHNSGLSTKRSASKDMQWSEQTKPSKKRAKYSLRDQPKKRSSDDINMSDTEFEDLIQSFQSDSDSDSPPGSGSTSLPNDHASNTAWPLNSQRAPIAQMMNPPAPEQNTNQTETSASSTAAPPRDQVKDKIKSLQSSGSSPHMPPPPRPSQSPSKAKQQSPKQRKVILKTKNGNPPPDDLLARALAAKSKSRISSLGTGIQSASEPSTSSAQHAASKSNDTLPGPQTTIELSNRSQHARRAISSSSPQLTNYQKPTVSDTADEDVARNSSPRSSVDGGAVRENIAPAALLSEKRSAPAPAPLTNTSTNTQAKAPLAETPPIKSTPQSHPELLDHHPRATRHLLKMARGQNPRNLPLRLHFRRRKCHTATRRLHREARVDAQDCYFRH